MLEDLKYCSSDLMCVASLEANPASIAHATRSIYLDMMLYYKLYRGLAASHLANNDVDSAASA